MRKDLKLTTEAERRLVRASAAAEMRKLSKPGLRGHISRARRLRDKQRDLLRRQRLASRARTGSKHGGNERTARKAELFDQVLARFTRRLESMKATKATQKRTRGQTALKQKARTPRMKAMQAHVSSRGRRKQARRDAR